MIEMLRSLIREIDPAAEQSLNGFLDSLTMSQGVVFIDSKINQTEFMEKFREYAKSLFDEREAFIASFNLLLDGVFTKNLLLIDGTISKKKPDLQIDKIYDSTCQS